MSPQPKILLVEDDDFAAATAAEMLDSDYIMQRVTTGQTALDALAKEQPDLVLLDVDMPGMSGYEVCRALRDNPAIGDLPVIFLSGRVNEDERLAGYEAGGDDYLTKPVSAGELRTKIKLQLASHAERIRLKQDISGAFSTAITAMSSAAEMGAILQFMRASFICQDYATLCREVLNTLGSYGLEASVKIHGQQGSVSFSSNGSCSPLEDSVLANMYKQGHIFEFGSHISCSYEHITVIVKRVEGEDMERRGRMKDNLALLAEGVDARIVSMDSSVTVARQHSTLTKLMASTSMALHDIEQSHRDQGIRSNQIFNELQKRFDNSMVSIGITQSQEEELANMLLDAVSQARVLHDEGLKTGAHMGNILEQIKRAANQSISAIP